MSPTIVVIPARDEVDRITARLWALARQTVQADAVFLLANNVSTGPLRWPDRCPISFLIFCTFASTHSRRLQRALAMHGGWPWKTPPNWRGRQRMFLIMDADTIVPADWVERN